MSNSVEWKIPLFDQGVEQAPRLLDWLVAIAQPKAVYSEPINAGGYTIITASEVFAAGGSGFGAGGGSGPAEQARLNGELSQADRPDTIGGGGGMGGGGSASGRPVAVISIGPNGVEVKPIIDVTKLALTALTAWGAMMIGLRRMRTLRN